MRIQWHTPYRDGGCEGRYDDPEWPEDWPVPSVGHSVYLEDRTSFRVSSVDWFPYGEDSGDEPFVYVVLKKHQIGDRYCGY